MPCSGNSSQICGGSYAISVYQFAGDSPLTRTVYYEHIGCYIDCDVSNCTKLPNEGRAVNQSYDQGTASAKPVQCAIFCGNLGFTTFGVEGHFCYCTNASDYNRYGNQTNSSLCTLVPDYGTIQVYSVYVCGVSDPNYFCNPKKTVATVNLHRPLLSVTEIQNVRLAFVARLNISGNSPGNIRVYANGAYYKRDALQTTFVNVEVSEPNVVSTTSVSTQPTLPTDEEVLHNYSQPILLDVYYYTNLTNASQVSMVINATNETIYLILPTTPTPTPTPNPTPTPTPTPSPTPSSSTPTSMAAKVNVGLVAITLAIFFREFLL